MLAGLLVISGWAPISAQDTELPELPEPSPANTAKTAAKTGPSAEALAEIAGSLEIFFQLGLPDTKMAKWVHAQGPGIGPAFPGPYGQDGGTQGNAWLLREDADGTVEIVVNQSRVIKAKKLSPGTAKGAKGGDPGLPGVQIKPADFATDLKAMTQGWKRTLQVMSNARSNEDEDEDFSDMGSQYGQDFRGTAGEAMLLAAHLQRQGKAEQVREILPMVLKLGGTAEGSLNAAVSAMADGRLAGLTERWARQGDANAYAEGIDKLAAEFSRGWANREAAQMLAGRVRQQSPAEGAEEPLAKAAAELLLGLRAEQFAELPLQRNWLLAGAEGAQRQGRGRFSRYAPPSSMEESDESEADPGEAGDQPQSKKPDDVRSPVKAFFAKPREAVKALALLLGDGRFLRNTGAVRGGNYSYSYSSEETPEQALKRKYGKIARPQELGEMAEALLTGLLPERLNIRYDGDRVSVESVRAWVEEISNLNDEELAWNYLRKSGQSSTSEFDLALNYLVNKGSAATLVKLQAVFQDPAVWRGNFDGVLVHLESYVKKAPGDQAAFGEKLKAAATTALEEEREQRGRYQSGMSAEYAKMQEAQEKAQLKKIDQFFKKTNLAEALAELPEGNDTELQAQVQALQPIVARTPAAEVEARVLQKAAKAKNAGAKTTLLGILNWSDRRREPAKQNLGAMDAETRVAAMALLKDETKLPPDPYRGGEGAFVGQVAANAILFFRFTPTEQAAWTQLYQTAPHLAPTWMRTAALAVAEGKPMPPAPSAARVPEAETAGLLKELGALPAEKVGEAIGARSPDEQLALIGYLERPKVEWPANFRAARLRIGEVSGELSGALTAGQWKGRELDQALMTEVTAAVDKATLAGKSVIVMVSEKGVLGGLTVSVTKNPQKITREQFATYPLKMPADKPAPDGFAAASVQGGPTDRSIGSAGYYYPLWKDAATTKTWMEEHRKNLAASATGTENPGEVRMRNDPATMEKAMKAIFELQPGGRKPFQLRWMGARIGEQEEKSLLERIFRK